MGKYKMIEVTTTSDEKTSVRYDQIACIAKVGRDTTIITLISGKELSIKMSYDTIVKMFEDWAK